MQQVLNHPSPGDLFQGPATGDAIRAWFKQQLRELGHRNLDGHQVRSTGLKVPQYDLCFASRHPLGSRLYRRSNRNGRDGQLGIELAS